LIVLEYIIEVGLEVLHVRLDNAFEGVIESDILGSTHAAKCKVTLYVESARKLEARNYLPEPEHLLIHLAVLLEPLHTVLHIARRPVDLQSLHQIKGAPKSIVA
jgi:hypothetical protein